MVSEVFSVGLFGLSGFLVSVECFISQGLPGLVITGLPDAAVKESQERVRAAMKNSGIEFPIRRIVINLAPADIRKEGSFYDLPILVGILSSAGVIPKIPENSVFIGELSLDGELRPVNGMLSMTMAAVSKGKTKIFCPLSNAGEAALIENAEVYGVGNVRDLLEHLIGGKPLDIVTETIIEEEELKEPDFSDVRGQKQVKRALEVAAAGSHNILMLGPPGSGKSMLARRLPSIMPRMTKYEALEATAIHSVLGLRGSLLTRRPFRSPHHTMSAPALVGGGRIPRPGEMSLAHQGVLFLDELPEFQRDALESLRQPIEDGQITISRAAGTTTYPAEFMLLCAMNPCRCGWYGSGRCSCTKEQVASYFGRISGPILDRLDIKIDVPSVSYDELASQPDGEVSAVIRERVEKARDCGRQRGQTKPNSQITEEEMREFCKLDDESNLLLKGAFERLGLTARAYTRVLKVSRTIADLDGVKNITKRHLAEALQYRQTNGQP